MEQFAAAWCQLIVPSHSDQQFVSEFRTQAVQRPTHSGLGEMDALRCPSHIALMKQRLERDQKVQVDVSELDFAHAARAYLPFQQCMVRLHPQNTPMGKGEPHARQTRRSGYRS